MNLRFFHLPVSILFLPLLFISSAISETAPDFSFKSGNETLRLSSLKGRVVYLDFWASWCTPCRKSFPWMNEMQQQYGQHGLSVITINLDQNREDAKAFLEKLPANFKIIYDPNGKVAELYGVKAMPTSFLIDRQGNLVLTKAGFQIKEKDELEKKIKALLNS